MSKRVVQKTPGLGVSLSWSWCQPDFFCILADFGKVFFSVQQLVLGPKINQGVLTTIFLFWLSFVKGNQDQPSVLQSPIGVFVFDM